MPSPRVISIVFVVFVLFIQTWFFGQSDIIAYVFIALISIPLIYRAFLEFSFDRREAVLVSVKKQSLIYRIFSSENAYYLRAASFFMSVFLAMSMVLTMKGLVSSRGLVTPAAFIIIWVGMVLHGFRLDKFTENDINKNIKNEVAPHVRNLVSIFLVAMILNVLLSLTFSMRDTTEVLFNQITFDNFDIHAAEDSIKKNNYNGYSRVLINIFIVLDYFKLAVSDVLVEAYAPDVEHKMDVFYFFYCVIFVLNLMKFYAFSLGVVLFHKGAESFYEKVYAKVKQMNLDIRKEVKA